MSAGIGEDQSAAAASAAGPSSASRIQLVSSAVVGPRLSLGEHDYPCYLVNGNFEIEWCNTAAEKAFLREGRALASVIEERGVFSSFFSGGELREARGAQDLLGIHLAIAKNRLQKTDLLAANADLGTDKLNEIALLYDQVEPIRSRDLISTEVDLGAGAGPQRWFNVYVSFFREGILFSYTPAASTPEAILTLLSRRDLVIRDILRARKPYMTKLAVVVADLQSSVKICAELPPEEYFELINDIWSAMGDCLRKYFATHGKHVGDGLVYYFLPQPDSNYLFNAIQCSQEMQETMKELSRTWKAKKNWFNDLQLNIGLDDGEEWFGIYSAPTYVEFAVLGDTINNTSRLSDFAQGGSVWITKSMLSKLSAAERARVRFGVAYSRPGGETRVVPSSYARMCDLIDVNDPKHAKLRDISASTITQIFDLAAAEGKLPG
jgi:adenylate cyclase